MQLVAEKQPLDGPARIDFCQWFQDHQQDVAQRIIYTDKCIFKQDGPWNSRNEHYWSQINPRATKSTSGHCFSLHVWAGLLNDQILGPVVLPTPMTSQLYLNFLQNNFPLLVETAQENVPYAERICRPVWYQLDGCGPHFGQIVREYLDQAYPGRWIGRGGLRAWPTRSPDLTPLDFFLWGDMKRWCMLLPHPNNVQELWTRINGAATDIQAYSIEVATLSIHYHTQICIQQNGGRFEQFLWVYVMINK